MSRRSHLGNRMVASTLQALDVKKPRTPGVYKIAYTTTRCPQCDAEPGQYCVSSNGKPATKAHIGRVRLALRKLTEQGEW